MRGQWLKRLAAGVSGAALMWGIPAAIAADATPQGQSEQQSPSPGETSAMAKAKQVVSNATYTVERFSGDSSLEWVRAHVGSVKGIFVVPEQIKGGFIVGGSGGNGVMLVRGQDGKWSYPAFYTMGSASFGLQAGAQVSEIVLLVMTDAGLNAFKSTSFKLGGDVSVAAGPIGGGAKAQTADILAFSRSKGLYGGLSLEGAVIQPREAWNSAYYGKTVTPQQVLFSNMATNSDADSLRTALASLGSGKMSSTSDAKSQ